MASTDPANPGDQEVFGHLPTSRPERRSAKRPARNGGATAATDTPARAKAKAEPKRTRTTAAKAKPKATAKPKAATGPKAKPRPRPATPPRSTVPPAGYATPRPDEEPSGRGNLLGTAVQAAGELTQIGVAAGSRAISSALKRLPRP